MKKMTKLLAVTIIIALLVQCVPLNMAFAKQEEPENGFLSDVWPGFVDPDQKHMTTPLWFWNEAIETMTTDKVREIVRKSYDESGYNGFGILPAFLSNDPNFVFTNEKFYEMYGAALDEASKLGMSVALYDEDGWPSGAAGGLVQKNHPEYTTRRLEKYEVDGDGGTDVLVPQTKGDYIGAVIMNNATKEVIDVSADIKAVVEERKNSQTGGNTHPGKTTASSTYTAASGYEADKATDGLESTRWNAGGGVPQWLELDFGSAQTFDKMEIIQPYKENPVLVRISNYVLEYWNGSAWVTLASGGVMGNSAVHTFAAVTAQKVRIRITALTTSSATIAEIKVWNGLTELTPFVDTPPTAEKYTIPQESGNWKLMIFDTVTQGNKGVDYLNPDAIAQYIDYTYAEFYRRFPQYFGTTIKRSFFDEPTMLKFREAGTDGNRTWTNKFNELFAKTYPHDNPMLYYPALFYDIGENTQEARDKLYTARAELFATSFIKQMNDWCNEHGIQYMGHMYNEETVNPVNNSGDLMRVFKYQDIPGVDHISSDSRTHDISRIISSSAYNWDKPLVMSETFGASNETLPLEDLYRWTMDEMAAGVNLIIPHAIWYNNQTNVFYPPELSYRSAKFGAALKPFNVYTARLNQLLQNGRHVADIGIYYPIDYLESNFIMNSDDCNPADANYKTILTTLAYNVRRDFTFLHPEVIDEKCTVEGDRLKLNNTNNYEQYNTFIIPGTRVMSLSNAQKIKAYYDAGGKVISAGQIPYKGIKASENAQVEAIMEEMFACDAQTGSPFEGAMANGYYRNTNQNRGIAYHTVTVNEAMLRTLLDDANDVYDVNFPGITVSGGRFSYIHKVKEGKDIYFLANSSANNLRTYVDIRGDVGSPVIWDPHTGTKQRPVSTKRDVNGQTVTRVEFSLASNKSIFIVDEELSNRELAEYAFKDAIQSAKTMDQTFMVRGKIELNRAIASANIVNDNLAGATFEQLAAITERLNAAIQNVLLVKAGNIAFGAAVTTNSAHTNATIWDPSKLVDGQNTAGGWSTAITNFDVNTVMEAVLDFGSVQQFDKIVIYPRQDHATKPFPGEFWFKISTDGIKWEEIYHKTNQQEVTTNDALVFNLDEAVDARYFKFEGTKLRAMAGTTPQAYGLQLSELEIYHTKSEAILPEREVIIVPSANGSVAVDKDIFIQGDTLAFTVTPDEGYMVQSVLVNGKEVTVVDNTFILPNVQDTVTVESVFKEILVQDVTMNDPQTGEPVTSVMTNAPFIVKVTTAGDVTKIKLVNENGLTIGKTLVSKTSNDDGTVTWAYSVSLATAGENRILDIWVARNSDYIETGVAAFIDIAPVDPEIFSAAAPESAVQNQTFEITVRTSKTVDKIKLTNETGASIGIAEKTMTLNGNEKTWVLAVKVGTSGNRIINVHAAGKDGIYLEETMPVAVSVIRPAS